MEKVCRFDIDHGMKTINERNMIILQIPKEWYESDFSENSICDWLW